MDEQQKRYVLWGAGGIAVLCTVAWLVMLFWPRPAPQPAAPLTQAGRPQYDYNTDRFIRENPEMFLSQLMPLVGNLEAAVAQGNIEGTRSSAAVLRGALVRWHDATPAALQPTINGYIAATEALPAAVEKKDGAVIAKSLGSLAEIKSLALQSQRASIQSLTQ